MPGFPSSLSPYSSFLATPIYDRCSLYLPADPLGIFGDSEIIMKLTKLDNVTVNSTTVEWASGPVIDTVSNQGIGGNAIALGVNQLPKLYFEGWIDSPYSVPTTGEDPMTTVPGILGGDGNIYNFVQLIAAYFQGNVSVSALSGSPWARIDPTWFRDPYGRCYQNPRILTFTASRTEAVPYRHTFTMTLLVGRNTITGNALPAELFADTILDSDTELSVIGVVG